MRRYKVQPIFERCTLFFRKFTDLPYKHPFSEKFWFYRISTPFPKNSQDPVPFKHPLPVPYRHLLPVPYNVSP